MDTSEEMETSCGLRRRSVGIDAPNLPLNFEANFKVADGGVIKGTPSPNVVKFLDDENPKPSSSLLEFRKKQQSFEIHIEDCDEEELSAGSSDEDTSRPQTPIAVLHFADSGGNVMYKEQPSENFLQVAERDQECLTDVSEGESENEDENEDNEELQERTVIKRVPH